MVITQFALGHRIYVPFIVLSYYLKTEISPPTVLALRSPKSRCQ